ncbi:MAG: DUF2062 domain-containing protein [Saprospiraceae bacterium]|nr:MAG: DUF2062 domain-containing protein [Saprospiraceae bacterium]
MKKKWLKNKRVQQLKALLSQGTSPAALALSTTLGVLLGLFPILGTTTVAITLIAVVFRLNLPLMMALSYLVYPVQLLLIIPFIRLGEWMFGQPGQGLTLASLRASLSESFLGAVGDLWSANICGAFGWAMLAAPAGLLLYVVLERVFSRYLKRREEETPRL